MGIGEALMIKIGIVGARGLSTLPGFTANEHAEVVAVCDLDADRLDAVAAEHAIPHRFRVFDDMLTAEGDAEVDAVVIATPMQAHVPQTIAALEAGKDVLCEVTAAVTMEELYWLTETVQRTGRTYMLAENYCYAPPMMLMAELARSGMLGEVYFGEGEYLHDIRGLLTLPGGGRSWRHQWQLGKRGSFYPTHSLGPVMQCFPGDRIAEISTWGSGRHHGLDVRQEDTTVTVCQLESGKLVRIRVDCLSPRPHQMAYYQIQGTGGVVEFSRFPGEDARVWLAEGDPALFSDYDPDGAREGERRWQPLSSLEQHLPERYRAAAHEQIGGGHGGGDFFIVDDFVATLRGEIPNPIDVYRAAEWTAVGLLSEVSIAAGGKPVAVPHFRPGLPLSEQVTRFI